MKEFFTRVTLISFSCLITLMVCGLAGCAPQVPLRHQFSAPAAVTVAEFSPGLAVFYLDNFYRRTGQMPTLLEAQSQGRPGKPIAQLNHKFAPEGLVFDSGESKGVGMVLAGYLHLAEPGEYRFQALANDGIEFSLGGNLLFEDPIVHSDRLSPVGIADIGAGGWYPILIRYFQRKGTATLKFYWQPPGATEFSLIPLEVYAH
jgi:PA14 domain